MAARFDSEAHLTATIKRMTETPPARILKAPKVKKAKPAPEENLSSVSSDPEPETLKPTNNAMASTFALACDALVRERDRVFLLKVSEDYKIPFEELEAKYLTAAADAIKVPKVRKAKVTVEGANKCQAQTAKKGPCSFSALKGECFCKRHLAQQNTEPKPAKPAKEPKVKAVKPVKVEPAHTHEPSETRVADCDLCESHGSALAEEEDFEIVMDKPEAEADAEVEADESEYDSE
jgi:hypothetical protein